MKKEVLFSLLVICAVTFSSCKKEGCVKSQQNSEIRQCLATRSSDGQIINALSPEQVTAIINGDKKTQEFVIESYSIIDKTDSNPYYVIFHYIDLNDNEAYSSALIGDYIEEIMNEFYVTEEVASGNTSFRLSNDSIVQFVDRKEVQPEKGVVPPGVFMTCRKRHCKEGSCEPRGEGHNFHCTECQPKQGHQTDKVCEVYDVGDHHSLLYVAIYFLFH